MIEIERLKLEKAEAEKLATKNKDVNKPQLQPVYVAQPIIEMPTVKTVIPMYTSQV